MLEEALFILGEPRHLHYKMLQETLVVCIAMLCFHNILQYFF